MAAAATTGRAVKIRIILCSALLLILFGVIAARAYSLQIMEGDRYRQLADEQHLKHIQLAPQRGSLLDRQGAPLAVSVQVDSIYANPRMIGSRAAEVADTLAPLLDIEVTQLRQRLSAPRYFAWVKRRVTPDEAHAVQALNLRGIFFTEEARRFYPSGALGATVIGFAGLDGRGLEGLELAFDGWLRGSSIQIQGLRDALGRHLFAKGYEDRPRMGHHLTLTLDRFIQYETERALAERYPHVHPEKGWVGAIVMDPRTGDILAMANLPSYDPNHYGQASAAHRRNRLVADAFEPGSTMKPFSIAAALAERVITTEERIDCEMGRWRVGRHTLHDTHPYRHLSITEIVQKSSNIGTSKIAMRLGRENLHDALRAFGFAQRTGIPLRGERAGVLHKPGTWSTIGLTNIAFGHGLTITALQLAQGFAVLGNGGELVKPRIALSIRNEQGQVVKAYDVQRRRVLDADVAQTMLSMMATVTQQGGTATEAALPYYTVAGKTGTAQKVDPATGTYAHGHWLASFVGLVPATNPRLVIVVIVDEPTGKQYYGGQVAAPVFRHIAEKALHYLGVKPDRTPTERELARKGRSEKATPAAALVTEGTRQVDLVPPLPGHVPQVMGTLQVPDFRGMSMASAIRAAREADIDIEIEGSGQAVAQDPAPGPASQGTVCQITFRPPS